jgi:ATP-dependent RNA helicase DeaD
LSTSEQVPGANTDQPDTASAAKAAKKATPTKKKAPAKKAAAKKAPAKKAPTPAAEKKAAAAAEKKAAAAAEKKAAAAAEKKAAAAEKKAAAAAEKKAAATEKKAAAADEKKAAAAEKKAAAAAEKKAAAAEKKAAAAAEKKAAAPDAKATEAEEKKAADKAAAAEKKAAAAEAKAAAAEAKADAAEKKAAAAEAKADAAEKKAAAAAAKGSDKTATGDKKAGDTKKPAGDKKAGDKDAKTTFDDLGLTAPLLKALAGQGYTEPTPIQATAIPPLLERRDLIGLAQTGTGKTAAFALPLLQSLTHEKKAGRPAVQALVLAPTRELAMQVSAALSTYAKFMPGIKVLTVYGGAPIGQQLHALDRGVHVVVGTPGRVMDCMRRGALSLETVRTVVLDEADEMLRMGFIDDIEWVLQQVPSTRQLALFSATMSPPIERVANTYLRDPVRVAVKRETRTVANIEERVVIVQGRDKLEVLTRILEVEESGAVLIFARTKAGCAELTEILQSSGFSAEALHGDLNQNQRQEVVKRMKSGRTELVVATDVAARGLDIDDITHVINFEPPNDVDTYVHRVGRTGRAGRDGIAILFLTPRERFKQRQIERHTRQQMVLMAPPSNEDIAAGRRARFRKVLEEVIAHDKLEPYRTFVTEMLCQTEHEIDTVAAALVQFATRRQPLFIERPEPRSHGGHQQHQQRERAPYGPPDKRMGGDDRQRRDDRPQRNDRPRDNAPRPQRNDRSRDTQGDAGGMTRMFVSLGRRAGVMPGDLVGAIANEGGVPGTAVGGIELGDKFGFFELESRYVDQVVERMTQTTIRGRQAGIRVARPPGAPGGPSGPPNDDPSKGPPPRSDGGMSAPKRRPEVRHGGPKKHYRGRS